MPPVTVMMTVRNGEVHLPATLESISQQTFSEFEIIIIDDGSTDGTARLLEKYAAKESRATVVSLAVTGRGRSLNVALRRTSSSLVANLDADDPMHPRRLADQIDALELKPSLSVLGTGTVETLGGASPRWPPIPDKPVQTRDVTDVTNQLVLRNPINHSSVLMRAAAVRGVGGYDERRVALFDYDLWVRLAAQGHRIGVLNRPLTAKRLHDRQSFERRKRIRYLRESARVQARAISALKGGARAKALLVARVAWGILPWRLRAGIRRRLVAGKTTTPKRT